MNEYNCEFIDKCSDIKKLRKIRKAGKINEGLEDQFYELCSTGGFKCSKREEYLLLEKQREDSNQLAAEYILTGGVLID